jgi:hypothetical protein
MLARAGLWIDSFPMLALVAFTVTSVVVLASLRELKDLLDDIRANRARKNFKLVSSRHR